MSGPRPQPDHSSARYHDLIYDKTKALTDFFTFDGKAPAAVTPADAQAWPQSPHAYQSDSAKALDDDEVTRLLQAVQERAAAGDLAACRDYALPAALFRDWHAP